MSNFTARLSALTSAEMAAARGDGERLATMFERLLHSAGFTIAMMADGDKKRMDELLTGAESYLYEAAAEHAPVGKLLGELNRGRR